MASGKVKPPIPGPGPRRAGAYPPGCASPHRPMGNPNHALNTGGREPTAGWAEKTPDWARTGDLETRIYNTGVQTAKLRALL